MLTDNEIRQLTIIMQNALSHATKIEIHNSQGLPVSVDAVVATAKKIAQEVLLISKKAKGN